MGLLLALEIESGPRIGEKIWLRKNQVYRIGRTDHADFAIPDDNTISGTHFLVEANEACCRLRDLQSRNGTRLNGQLIAEAALLDGDVIRAGNTEFRVHLKGVSYSERPLHLMPGGSEPSDSISYATERLDSGVNVITPAEDNCTILDVTRSIVSHRPFFIVVDLTAFTTRSMGRLDALVDAHVVNDEFGIVAAPRTDGWEQLIENAWGKDAVALLLTTLDEPQLVSDQGSLAAALARPSQLEKQISSAPRLLVEQLFAEIEAVILEQTNGSGWKLFSNKYDIDSCDCLGLPGTSIVSPTNDSCSELHHRQDSPPSQLGNSSKTRARLTESMGIQHHRDGTSK